MYTTYETVYTTIQQAKQACHQFCSIKELLFTMKQGFKVYLYPKNILICERDTL